MSLTPLKELMVLGAVRAHPAHGYALAEILEQGLGPTLGLTRPTLYATLQRFEKRGWLTSKTARDRRFPDRQVYKLTRAGDQAYARLLERCASGEPEPIVPLVALLSQLDELPKAERRAALERIRDQRKALIQTLAHFPPHGGSAGIAVELWVGTLRLEVKALEKLLA